MKAPQATAAQAEVGTSKGVEIVFTASSKDVAWTLTGSFPLIPGTTADVSRKAYQAMFGQCVYRSSEAKKVLPEGGGEVDFAALMIAVAALTFRGEAVPNNEDKQKAAHWFKGVKAKLVDPAEFAKTAKAKYGWDVDAKTEEGLLQHFFKARMYDASKASGFDLETV
jgi:hypothetical protein